MTEIMAERNGAAPKTGAGDAVPKPAFAARLLSPTASYLAIGIVATVILVTAMSVLASILIDGWASRDMAWRARIVYRSIHDQVAGGIVEKSGSKVVSLFNRVAEDERILALGFCSANGKLAFSTRAMPANLRCENLPLSDRDTFLTLADDRRPVRVSIFPMTAGEVSGHLLILHDLRYIKRRTHEVRLYATLALIGVAAGFALLTSVVVLALTRGWARSLRGMIADARRGGPSPSAEQNAFPIGKEISALLTEFRVERKFTNGVHVEWSPKTLHQLLNDEMPGAEVLIVSNREPYIHNRIDGEVQLQIPASGLVSALEPVMRACGGAWIAHGSGSADHETVDARDRLRVPPADPAYTLRRVWLSDEEQDGYYYGFANEGLWPLCHIAFVRPTFRKQDWSHYKAVNERFAATVAEEATCDDPIVLVQDYHFALLPRMIRKRLPKATIITFWHIPWPNAETFSICPWREEIMDGLLGSSILGFHTQFHCNNFLEAADRFMESRIDRESSSVTLGGHETLIRPYPISIEWPPAALAGQAPIAECRSAVRRRFGLADDVRIAVGVERFDYTKGILDRMKAVDDLLDRQPEWRGKFVLLQVAAPTRGKLDAYGALQTEAIRLAEEINARYAVGGCKPIQLVIRHHEPHEVFELFRAADVCVVSSLHDGMNLVAKEFVAARDDDAGVLILSSFAGAARELSEALIVNPYDTHGMSEGFDAALRMPLAEQGKRIKLMRDLIRQRNVYRWAAQMLLDAAWLRRREGIFAAAKK